MGAMAGDATSQPPAATAALPLHALAYDELPSGSDVRREYGSDGAVTIAAPAGEPSAAARRAAAQGTGVSSAALCGAVMLGLMWVGVTSFGIGRLEVWARSLAGVLFAVVWGGVFLLAWKARYADRLDLLARARRESALLHATPWRLIIEKAGQGGLRSFDLPAGRVKGLRVVGEPVGGDGAGSAESVPCLRVELTDGSAVYVMHGRHEVELQWVASTLEHCMGLAGAGQGGLRLRTLWRLGLW